MEGLFGFYSSLLARCRVITEYHSYYRICTCAYCFATKTDSRWQTPVLGMLSMRMLKVALMENPTTVYTRRGQLMPKFMVNAAGTMVVEAKVASRGHAHTRVSARFRDREKECSHTG